jgi:hypothetical protein
LHAILEHARTPRGRRIVGLLVAATAILTVGGPMFFTRGGYSEDFTNTLWLIWVAGHHFGHSLWPSFFLNADASGTINGIFNPEFAFYGGPLYTAAGALSALLFNHAAIAYALITAVALSGAYGGCWWLARQCGVRGLLAHVPAIVMLSGAYYVTDLYGRGAWSEFVAVSSIPMVLAAAGELVRRRWCVWSVLLFVVATCVFTGSHNITLEWGVLVIAVVGGALLAAYQPSGIARRRVLGLGILALLTAGINAWFLLPDITYAGRTQIGSSAFNWSYTSAFDTVGVLFDPLREVPSSSSTPALFVQAPVWFLLWALIVGVVLWRGQAMARLRRAWTVVGLGIVVVLALLLFESPWRHMPHLLLDIQFTYRLDAYVLLLSVAFVTVAVLALQRLGRQPGHSVRALRSLAALLALALAVSVGLCVWQLWEPNTAQSQWYKYRDEALAAVTSVPKTWYSGPDYADNSLPLVPVVGKRVINIDAKEVDVAGNKVSTEVNAPPGPQPIATNILGGPYLVDVSGLRVVGRTADHQLAVVRIHGTSGKVHVVIGTRTSRAVVLGRVITIVCVLAILALLGWLSVRGFIKRRRRGKRATTGASVTHDS